MLFINFKSYPESSGNDGLQLASICQKVMQEQGIKIIPCVQTADLGLISSRLKISVWAQHFDLKKPDKNTGWVTAYSLKQAGAEGVLINHSEHPVDPQDIHLYIKSAEENGLKTLVFTANLDLALEVDQYEPDYLFLETPKLISKRAMADFPEEREKIKKFVAQVKACPLVGAGISSCQDVKKSLALGVKGVGLASAFILAENPESVLKDLIKGFKN